MSSISISQPIYLESSYDNVPLLSSWNQGLAESLLEIARQVGKVGTDIHELEIEKNEDFHEFNAAGSVGYSFPSKIKTGYFYVEFLSSSKDTKELFASVQSYSQRQSEYFLSKCTFDTDESAEGLIARAYFVKDISELER